MAQTHPESEQQRPEAAQAAVHSDRLRAIAVAWASRLALVPYAMTGRRRRGPGFGILMYHRVANVLRGVAKPTYSVTPEQLHDQLQGLLALGFQAWPLSVILDHQEAGRTIPANVFAVTFDDGYENNLTAALPVLQKLGVPATLFLATAFLDSNRPFPCDDWSAAGWPMVPTESWRPLSTAQCHRLLASGLFELGAHTHTHGSFLNRPEAFRHDLQRSLQILADRFQIQRPAFAYPFGDTSPQLAAEARAAGARCGLTVRFERVRPGDDPFAWGRFNADDADTAATLAAKLSGWYEPVAAAIRLLKRPFSLLAANHSTAATNTNSPIETMLPGERQSDTSPSDAAQSGMSWQEASAS